MIKTSSSSAFRTGPRNPSQAALGISWEYVSSVYCLKIAFLYTRPIRLAPLVAYTLANLMLRRENNSETKTHWRVDQLMLTDEWFPEAYHTDWHVRSQSGQHYWHPFPFLFSNSHLQIWSLVLQVLTWESGTWAFLCIFSTFSLFREGENSHLNTWQFRRRRKPNSLKVSLKLVRVIVNYLFGNPEE